MIKQLLRQSTFARKAAACFRKIVYLRSEDYHFLKDTKGNKRIIYLAEIDHGNLGDHAINYAVRELMSPYRSDFENEITVGWKYCLGAIEAIGKETGENDLIIVPGGGWIGTLWKESGELFIKILEVCAKSKIIVFPQTITFDATEYGREQEEKLYHAIDNCGALLLMVRDKKSYDFLINKMPKENSHIRYLLTPDAALSIHPDLDQQRDRTVGFCFRKDKEKAVSADIVSEIKQYAAAEGYDVVDFDTVRAEHVRPEQRKDALYKLWGEIAKMKIVVTDRLHGMVFAAITNTPCLAFNNVNGKVSAVYELWLSKNESIKVLDLSRDDWKKEFNDLIEHCGANAAENDELKSQFKNMSEIIAEFI